MRNYTTQMDAARKGIVTPEIEIVAKKENMTTEALMKLVAEGKVAIFMRLARYFKYAFSGYLRCKRSCPLFPGCSGETGTSVVEV